MTKAKARQRAKAKAAQKLKKRISTIEQTKLQIKPGQYNQESGSIKSPRNASSTQKFGRAIRGSQRSR